jgi:maltooligosyltrehalose trehalohydrolase
LYFTDHHRELGRRVTEGRRREFRQFAAFTDPATRERIPDPQAPATFEASRLDWPEQQRQPHAGVLRLYKELLHLRHTEPALRAAGRDDYDVSAVGASGLVLLRRAADGPDLVLVCEFLQGARVRLDDLPVLHGRPGRRWEVVLTTEDPRFCPDPDPPRCDLAPPARAIDFGRPGAVLLRGHPAPPG